MGNFKVGQTANPMPFEISQSKCSISFQIHLKRKKGENFQKPSLITQQLWVVTASKSGTSSVTLSFISWATPKTQTQTRHTREKFRRSSDPDYFCPENITHDNNKIEKVACGWHSFCGGPQSYLFAAATFFSQPQILLFFLHNCIIFWGCQILFLLSA